jgi:putative endonuclease
MIPVGFIYIITNRYNTVLYTGVTNNLPTRLWEHSTKKDPKCFTARYNLFKLVYYEGFETFKEAIKREKYIKHKNRLWKKKLIESLNPEWKDLTDEFV